jgi:hypothetical protein
MSPEELMEAYLQSTPELRQFEMIENRPGSAAADR